MANVRCKKKKYGKLLLENIDEKNVVGTCKSMRLTLETKEISFMLLEYKEQFVSFLIFLQASLEFE